MKIGPFVSFSKWPEELGSVDCVFIACSLPSVRLIPWEPFFSGIVRLIFPVEGEFFLLARACMLGAEVIIFAPN